MPMQTHLVMVLFFKPTQLYSYPTALYGIVKLCYKFHYMCITILHFANLPANTMHTVSFLFLMYVLYYFAVLRLKGGGKKFTKGWKNILKTI